MEKARLQLITNFPFYAMMLQKCVFTWFERVQTAGVRINQDGKVELTISKKFFYSLSENHRIGLLMHEMLHLCMDHCKRGKDLNHQLANIAMDIAINQYIPDYLLPDGALLPEQFGFEKNKTFEHYYLDLVERMEKNQSPIENQPLDNHDWAKTASQDQGNTQQKQAEAEAETQSTSGTDADAIDSKQTPGTAQQTELSQEIKDAIIDKLVNQAAEEAMGRGDLPSHISRMLPSAKAKAKINWKSELKKYIGRNLSDVRESTRNKPNRRMGLMANGTQRVDSPKVIIACDQSGSVSDDACAKLLTEAKKILTHLQDKTEFVYFDTKIAHVETLRKVSDLPERKCSGGTDFQAAIDYAESKRPDLLIILTDGEAPMPEKPRFPIIWLVEGKSDIDHLIGNKIRLE